MHILYLDVQQKEVNSEKKFILATPNRWNFGFIYRENCYSNLKQ